MKTNVKTFVPAPRTAEGAIAARISPEQELRRTLAACVLWEGGFYESGVSIAERIKVLVPKCRPEFVAACAFEARTKMKLRHAPLLVVREMARATPAHRLLVGRLLPDVIQRADEMAEFLAMYWADGGKDQPLSKQVKKGLAAAFGKFDEYQFAKYNRDGDVKLRDALFLSHAKPRTIEREALYKKIVDGALATPDTWEVALSGGADKLATFTRLMHEGKLGGLAFLRNLRNMLEAGVQKSDAAIYATMANFDRVLPFRFIAAARVVPTWEDIIEPAMLRACEGREKLPGRTVVLLDVSGSMGQKISAKSDLARLDAAVGVGILLRELCEDIEVVTFSTSIVNVPPRRGFALRDAIVASQPHLRTYLGAAVRFLNEKLAFDRIVVLTDEQSHDAVGAANCEKAYMINVASDKNGVAYGPWRGISGWSESVIDYIVESEKLEG